MKNSILLFLATVVSLMAYGADPQPDDYNETYKTMTISTRENLTWLASQVNNGNSYEDWTITLGNDLDMSTITFIPIGTEEKPFEGVFQGNNKTIRNLSFSEDVVKNIGLFGYTGTTFEVSDLTVSYSIEIASNRACLGLLVGYNNGKVVNCTNLGDITCTSKINKNSYGCLVGQNSTSGQIKDCVNNGDLNIDITINKTLMGGIAGSNEGIITNCINNGNITGKQSVGGIAGSNKGTVSGCINDGNVSGESYAGGIAGMSTGKIEKCTNEGTITASNSYAGGIVAYLNNIGTTISYLINCFSSGDVSVTTPTSYYYVGAIIGRNGEYPSVTNCYYAAKVKVTGGSNEYTCESPYGCGIGRETSPADSYESVTVYFSTTIHANPVDGYGWATYYNSAANMLADEGTTVYTATLSGDGETLVLTEVADRIVKKGQGVILKRSGEGDFLLTATATAATDSYYTSNVLTGVDASTAQATGQDYFVLGTGSNGLGFYKLMSTTDLGSHKAFVVLTAGSPVRAMLLDDSQTAAIGHVTATKATQPNTYTDLLGRKVDTPRKGIYMVNGKKTVVR